MEFVGFASVIATFIFRVVPIIGIVKVIKTGEIRHVPFVLYLCTLISTSFFTMYGYKITNWPVMLINGSAMAVMPIYLTVYIIFLPYLRMTKIALILSLYSFVICLNFIGYTYFPKEICGSIAVTLSFIVQSSQIFTVAQVIETKNSIYVDVALISAFALTNILNTTYGLLQHKVYLWFSMSWGLLWNFVQIIMSFIYPKDETMPVEDKVPEVLDNNAIVIYNTEEGKVRFNTQEDEIYLIRKKSTKKL